MRSGNNEERRSRLARVRDNQRKSRARRQQYVQELEQKVAVCKAQAQQKDIEDRISLQKLELENTKLRNLLRELGVDGGYINEYLHEDQDHTTTEKIAIPALKTTDPLARPTATAEAFSCNPRCKDAGLNSSFSTREVADGTRLQPPQIPLISINKEIQPDQSHEMVSALRTLYEANTICECLPGTDDSWPTNENSLNTTLCVIAEELIHQYNTRGMDLSIIKEKLWTGFRKGIPASEGCRVQNHILFEVLDEISENMS